MTDTRSLALITGASCGIGHELARQFARHGHDLVVNAEDESLESAAQGLRERGAQVRAVRADLRTAEGRFRLLDALDGLTVDVAVLNVKDTGVTVTSFMPGPTDTGFFDRAGMAADTRIGTMKKDDPAQVAEQAFEAIVKGEKKAVTGSLKTKAQGPAGKVLPDAVKAAAHRRLAEPGTAPDEGHEREG